MDFAVDMQSVIYIVVVQWRFGATVVKPTGLLGLRFPSFLVSMYKHADFNFKKPTNMAIGKHQDGSLKTSSHWEYLAASSAGLARVIILYRSN